MSVPGSTGFGHLCTTQDENQSVGNLVVFPWYSAAAGRAYPTPPVSMKSLFFLSKSPTHLLFLIVFVLFSIARRGDRMGMEDYRN
jgi:hypothetical protein